MDPALPDTLMLKIAICQEKMIVCEELAQHSENMEASAEDLDFTLNNLPQIVRGFRRHVILARLCYQILTNVNVHFCKIRVFGVLVAGVGFRKCEFSIFIKHTLIGDLVTTQ